MLSPSGLSCRVRRGNRTLYGPRFPNLSRFTAQQMEVSPATGWTVPVEQMLQPLAGVSMGDTAGTPLGLLAPETPETPGGPEIPSEGVITPEEPSNITSSDAVTIGSSGSGQLPVSLNPLTLRTAPVPQAGRILHSYRQQS